jgi:hypothetical protein
MRFATLERHGDGLELMVQPDVVEDIAPGRLELPRMLTSSPILRAERCSVRSASATHIEFLEPLGNDTDPPTLDSDGD